MSSSDLEKCFAENSELKDMLTSPGNTIIAIDNEKIKIGKTLSGIPTVEQDITAENLLNQLGTQVPIDTGLIPTSGSGMLSFRQFGDYRQIAMQMAPMISLTEWGEYENDSNVGIFNLAYPYRVIIADLHKGNLLGARMFYRTKPVTSLNDELYHINLPNVNCYGYGTGSSHLGVGWLCLYHTETWSEKTIEEQLAAIVSRSTQEAYNNRNMSETDGIKLYRELGKKENRFLITPESWEAKTKEEGLDWVLNEDMWVKVLVKSLSEQTKHVGKGIPLTFGAAIYNSYHSYYSDNQSIKPINYITSKTKADFEDAPSNQLMPKKISRNELYISVLKKALSSSYGKAISIRSSLKFSPKGYVK